IRKKILQGNKIYQSDRHIDRSNKPIVFTQRNQQFSKSYDCIFLSVKQRLHSIMMDDRRVAEYFVVAGLPPKNPDILAEFSCDGATLKSTHSLPPVTDVGVVNRSLGE
ncbi:hypothetical protein Avbf_01318, partial [Armadillidium vulgare]